MHINPGFRTPACLACLLALALGLGACQPKDAGVSQTEEGQLVLGEVEETATAQRGVILAGRTLVLDGFRGNVWLNGTQADVASFVFTRQARGRTPEDAARALAGITLEEAGDDATFTYTLRAKAPELSRIDVTGDVPRGTTLRIQLGSGDVALSGIDGPLEVKVEGGTVVIGGAGASVTVETRNGAVDLGLYRLPAGSAVRVRATNGDLALTLPGSVAARIDAQTSAGDITTEGLTFSTRKLEPVGAGARFQGQLGSGGATVTLRTENGAVALHEGSVLRLPPRPGMLEAQPDTMKADTTKADTTRALRPADSLRAPIGLRPPGTEATDRQDDRR